ncbi:MAG: ribonuclease P protein component [Xanthobacteraceae bacterium]
MPEHDGLGVSVAFANGPLERGHAKIAAKVATMERLKRRSDFRAVAQAGGAGARVHASAFILQARARAQAGAPRVGFTVSKQVGNAVERNRVRRRLRELIRLAPPAALSAGHDYVLIGRRAALKGAFDAMMKELSGALRRVHRLSKDDSAKYGSSKSGAGTGASGVLSPHRAGPSKGRGGKSK